MGDYLKTEHKEVSQQFFDRSNLERLANQDHTEVYEYVFDKPERLVPVTEVEDLIKEARNRYLQLKMENPYAATRDYRQWVLKDNPTMQSFSRTHPRIFETCVNPATTEDDLQRIRYLLFLKRRQEAGVITEELATHTLNNFLLTEFKGQQSAPSSNPNQYPKFE